MEKSRKPEPKTNIYISKFTWQDPGLIDLTRARERAQGFFGDCPMGSGANVCGPSGAHPFDLCGDGLGFV